MYSSIIDCLLEDFDPCWKGCFAGLVQILNGKPVVCENCVNVIPDTDKKSTLYFHDLGTVPKKVGSKSIMYESRYRAVVWINKVKLGICDPEAKAKATNEFIQHFTRNKKGICPEWLSVGNKSQLYKCEEYRNCNYIFFTVDFKVVHQPCNEPLICEPC